MIITNAATTAATDTSPPSFVGIYIACLLSAAVAVFGWMIKRAVRRIDTLSETQATQSTALALLVERVAPMAAISGDVSELKAGHLVLREAHRNLQDALDRHTAWSEREHHRIERERRERT